ncbi:MAG: glycosyltransferase family 4 protein [Devosiaceae bacterium]|nr:glycosyltransferase family 4 protein [Devosiaceae bacterium]
MTNSPLRILQILRSPIGGLFRHVVDLSNGLIELGHEVGIVLDGEFHNAQSDGLLNEIEPKLALGVHRLDMSRLLSISDITTPIKVRKLASSLGVNVLHGHGAKGAVNARIAKSKKSVALYTPHGGVLHYSPKSTSGKLFRLADKILLLRTDAVIFESQFAQREFHAQIAVPKCLNPVIHNGLRESEFEPVKANIDAQDFAFIGELRQLKGIMILLDALVNITNSNGKPATLVIAGSGPIKKQIEARINEPDLRGRVEMLGVRPAREVFTLGRCLVVPSLHESLPYVVLEGSAANRPIIATDVGGISEIFGPTSKSLIEAGSKEALQNSMEKFLKDEIAAQAEAATRKKHVKETFFLEKMVKEIEAVYNLALNKGKSGR